MALSISSRRCNVGDLDRPPSFHNLVNGRPRSRMKQTASTACQSKRGRHVVRRSHAKSAPFILVENPKFCLASDRSNDVYTARRRLNFDFIHELHKHFLTKGPEVIERAAQESPATYLKVLGQLVPNSRTAFDIKAWKTGSSSPAELEITRSTSDVAVCCSSASRSCRRAASSSRSRRARVVFFVPLVWRTRGAAGRRRGRAAADIRLFRRLATIATLTTPYSRDRPSRSRARRLR